MTHAEYFPIWFEAVARDILLGGAILALVGVALILIRDN